MEVEYNVMATRKVFRATFNTNSLDQRQKRLEKLRQKTRDKARRKWLQFLKDIPKFINGELPLNTAAKKRIHNAFWSAIVLSLFEDIYEAYESKSQLGTDTTGEAWADLSPYTKAYKRSRKGFLSTNQRAKLRQDTPGLLTPRQYAQWKKVFAKCFQKFTNGGKLTDPFAIEDAKRKAAAVAWIDAKRRGAETLLSVLGEKDMLVMRVTDRLYSSLRPGKISNLKYRKGHQDQVVKYEKGGIELGTKVPYAKMAEGPLGKSHRKIWPTDIKVWYDRAVEKARDAVAEQIKIIARVGL